MMVGGTSAQAQKECETDRMNWSRSTVLWALKVVWHGRQAAEEDDDEEEGCKAKRICVCSAAVEYLLLWPKVARKIQLL